MSNIKISVSSTHSDIKESQIYTNNTKIKLAKLKHLLRNKIVGTEVMDVANFPHMSGTNQPVMIAHVWPTKLDDNTGIDVTDIIKIIQIGSN